MAEFKVVDRANVPTAVMRQCGKYAQIYAAMAELKTSQAVAVPVSGRKHGAQVKRELAALARKELRKDGDVCWSRSADDKNYFFWFEKS